ncbi:MAG: hypothetical protein QXY62_02135 [Candidatus Altiarchaeota archaeon]
MKILNLFGVLTTVIITSIFLGCINNIPVSTTTTLTTEARITTIITTTEMRYTTPEILTTFTTTTIKCNDSCVIYGFPTGFCLDECSENFVYIGNEGCFEQKCCCLNFEFEETTTTSTTLGCNAKCCTNSDCGVREVTHNYTCDANLIYSVYTDPVCKYPGTPSAQCIRIAKRELLKRCDEKEDCIEDEPYCAFVSYGEYKILEEPPKDSQIFPISNTVFSGYDIYSFKIKYVISKSKKPDGLCLYVRSPEGIERKIYLTDKYGEWIDENTRIGISRIFIYGSTILAEMWGMKQERI